MSDSGRVLSLLGDRKVHVRPVGNGLDDVRKRAFVYFSWERNEAGGLTKATCWVQRQAAPSLDTGLFICFPTLALALISRRVKSQQGVLSHLRQLGPNCLVEWAIGLGKSLIALGA